MAKIKIAECPACKAIVRAEVLPIDENDIVESNERFNELSEQGFTIRITTGLVRMVNCKCKAVRHNITLDQ